MSFKPLYRPATKAERERIPGVMLVRTSDGLLLGEGQHPMYRNGEPLHLSDCEKEKEPEQK